jgi:hypothetical protein
MKARVLQMPASCGAGSSRSPAFAVAVPAENFRRRAARAKKPGAFAPAPDDDSLVRDRHSIWCRSVAANTKYSVNSLFNPVPHKCPTQQKMPRKSHASTRRLNGLVRQNAEEIREKDRCCHSPAAPSTGALIHKRRLVSVRQGFVSVTFMTPTSCVPAMWISGIGDAKKDAAPGKPGAAS